MMGRFSANDNYVLRRSERLGLSVMFFVLFFVWWRMVQIMELDNGARLQKVSGIPS
jgi:hypothetical protein